MANSQVCIVSNPYLVSMDGLPNIDFIFDDLRKSKRYSGIPKHLRQARKENNMRRLTRLELTEVLNKISQTKDTKKYTQSESLQAKQLLKNSKFHVKDKSGDQDL